MNESIHVSRLEKYTLNRHTLFVLEMVEDWRWSDDDELYGENEHAQFLPGWRNLKPQLPDEARPRRPWPHTAGNNGERSSARPLSQRRAPLVDTWVEENAWVLGGAHLCHRNAPQLARPPPSSTIFRPAKVERVRVQPKVTRLANGETQQDLIYVVVVPTERVPKERTEDDRARESELRTKLENDKVMKEEIERRDRAVRRAAWKAAEAEHAANLARRVAEVQGRVARRAQRASHVEEQRLAKWGGLCSARSPRSVAAERIRASHAEAACRARHASTAMTVAAKQTDKARLAAAHATRVGSAPAEFSAQVTTQADAARAGAALKAAANLDFAELL